ncbi:hypothetical protein ABZ470_36910 [Streptosporangium sp. NPDC020072]|uniref:hypothetical protein n=1 Tax=Streptosporangium sp. NPDC020072 TaxID=3154788 RepID=UPI003449AF69
MRLILDTNIWSYIGEVGARRELERVALSRHWTICTPPATLLEVLRTSDPARRHRSVDALSSKYWKRLRTEIDSECSEFIAEARRLRPKWVRQLPLPDKPRKLRNFWTWQIWRQATKDHAELANRPTMAKSEVDDELAYGPLKANRDARLESGMKIEDLDSLFLRPDPDMPPYQLLGWKSDLAPVEWWRVDCRDIYMNALRFGDSMRFIDPGNANFGTEITYSDWLGSYLWLDQVTADWDDFGKFWLYEVEKANVPRSWIRSATMAAQMMGKVEISAPRDQQLATYLIDCDVFVTADKRFASALERVRPYCPVPMAEIRCLKGVANNSQVVDLLAEAIS